MASNSEDAIIDPAVEAVNLVAADLTASTPVVESESELEVRDWQE
jgi:hypothetical protein